MDEEVYEDIDSINDTTEEVVNTEEVEDEVIDTDSEDNSDDDNGYDPVLVEKNKKLFERAKKAEAELKALKAKPQQTAAPVEKQTGLSTKDTLAFIDAKVTNEEDVDFVAEYAAFKKISIPEALKSPVVITELKTNAEQRTTAQATNTGSSRRGSSKPTGEQILNAAAQGKFSDDTDELAQARIDAKKKK